MGFGTKLQEWVSWCIGSPYMSVLVNGCPTKQFFLERGLRQGDPLSPFLFNFVAEVLSSMFFKAKDLGLIKGMGFGANAIHINHLQFADDTVLLIEASVEYLLNAKRILRVFELASGLKINFLKSCLVKIGKKSPSNKEFAYSFRCSLSSLPITYLGLPLGGNSNREAFWQPMIAKVEHRLAPWNRGFLFKGARQCYLVFLHTACRFSESLKEWRRKSKNFRGISFGMMSLFKNVHALDWDSLCQNKLK
ncbi:hypothetical protein Dsin_024453 [Dipteronia sinensis]|uniref:Reverse transcriptase domain-containing protein n=1 Tax=Dipteronia sinensis TaxID=43782 RepID=A0AAE0DW89_9ROSI|nr:hypothetical protein Dsin_024453 [Dipteronia sinensis]